MQPNSLANDDKLATYSRLTVQELESQLSEEKQFQNRNLIRQIIRKKRKESSDGKTDNEEKKSTISEEIENLKQSLSKTTDFFEQCKIRSSILHLQKKANSEQKLEPKPTLIEIPNPPVVETKVEKKTEVVYKNLIFDEMTGSNIESTKVVMTESVMFIWIMPFKVLSSIEYSWQFNDTDIDIGLGGRSLANFDGKQSTLTLSNVDATSNGIYKITINSQRLKRKVLKFKLVVNENGAQEPSSIIVEPVDMAPVKIETPAPASHTDEIISKPRYGLNKNRFQRHKTMVGEEMLAGLKLSMKEPLHTKNENEVNSEITSSSPPKSTPLRRFNRSATSAKDIILTFCKINTDEYNQYGVCVENLSTSWTDGLAFCALIHHFYPEAFDFSKLNKSNRRSNFQLAFDTADKYAEIYPLLDIEDMLIMERPDWKCIFTYVQCFYKTFRTHPKNKLKTVPI